MYQYGKVQPNNPLHDARALYLFNDAFLEPAQSEKLKQTSSDMKVALSLDQQMDKKVKKKAVTSASIRDCFTIDSCFSMWKNIHLHKFFTGRAALSVDEGVAMLGREKSMQSRNQMKDRDFSR